MRRLVASFVVVFCLAACRRDGGTIAEVDDGPFGGVYSLRQINDYPPPIYFWGWWYPGRTIIPGLVSSTLMSADLTIRPDGTFTWTTQLEEVATRQGSQLLENVLWTVRRDAHGTWKYTPSTGAVSLEGLDQSGPYVLTGSTTSPVLTLSSTVAGANLTFVLER